MIVVVDVVLVAEWMWVSVMFLGRRIEQVLLLAGGTLASGYTAYTVSPWITRTFFPPSSPVFEWALHSITTNLTAVNAIGQYIPPQPTTTSGSHAQWIAHHILHTLVYSAITLAIFLCFLVISALRQALWDYPEAPLRRGEQILATAIQHASSLYLVAVTAALLGNLAWLKSFTWLAVQVNHSVFMRVIGHMMSGIIG